MALLPGRGAPDAGGHHDHQPVASEPTPGGEGKDGGGDQGAGRARAHLRGRVGGGARHVVYSGHAAHSLVARHIIASIRLRMVHDLSHDIIDHYTLYTGVTCDDDISHAVRRSISFMTSFTTIPSLLEVNDFVHHTLSFIRLMI